MAAASRAVSTPGAAMSVSAHRERGCTGTGRTVWVSRKGPPAGPTLCMGGGVQETVTAEVGGLLGSWVSGQESLVNGVG